MRAISPGGVEAGGPEETWGGGMVEVSMAPINHERPRLSNGTAMIAKDRKQASHPN